MSAGRVAGPGSVRLPEGYQLGPALPTELAQLARIETEAASVFPVEDLAPELREEGVPVSLFARACAAGRLWVVRTLDPPAPVGFAVVTLLDGCAHLHEMDVLPAHAGRGLGRALVSEAAGWARRQGLPALTLTTFRHLPWNGPFYARLGFTEVPSAQLGPGLGAALAEEAAQGLDPARRVAMRLELRTA